MDRTIKMVQFCRESRGRFVYIRGKYPNFEVGDTLACYYDDGNFEFSEGKVEKIELDSEIDDWLYTFEGGKQMHEAILVDEHFYKINN